MSPAFSGKKPSEPQAAGKILALGQAVLFFWPVLFCAGLRVPGGKILLFLLAAVSLVRFFLLFRYRREEKTGTVTSALAFLFSFFAALSDLRFGLWYPAAVNAVFFAVFAGSLFRGPPVIETLARKMEKKELSQRAKKYTRNVTAAWCFFFLLNGSTAALTAASGNLTVWMLWNGFLSYIAIGLFFSAEYLIRKRAVKNGD